MMRLRPSLVFEQAIGKAGFLARQQGFQRFPDRIRRWRTAGQEIVYLHDLVRRINPVEQERQVLVVWDQAAILDRRSLEIGFLQALAQSDEIAHRRNAAIDGAGADRDEDAAMLAELLENPDIVLVGATALHQTDIDDAIESLLVVERRSVEIDEIDQLDEPLVDVEERHVAAEAAGKRAGGQFRFRQGG